MGYYDDEDLPTVVAVHLETTDFYSSAHVMQVAAKCGRSVYNAYLLPRRPIAKEVTDTYGFYRSGMDLYVKGVRKHTLTVFEAVDGFIRFLRSLGGNVVLAGHNAFPFTAPHLLRLVKSAGLFDELEDVCVGFSDTLPLLRRMYPYIRYYRVADLLREFVPNEYYPHRNAVGYVRALDRLIDVTGLPDEVIVDGAKELDYWY